MMMWNERESRVCRQYTPPNITQACHTYSLDRMRCIEIKRKRSTTRRVLAEARKQRFSLRFRRSLCHCCLTCPSTPLYLNGCHCFPHGCRTNNVGFRQEDSYFPLPLTLEPKHHDEETKLKTDTETRDGDQILHPKRGTERKQQ